MEKYSIIFFSIVLLVSCSKIEGDVFDFNSREYPLENWRVIGPILTDSLISGEDIMRGHQKEYMSSIDIWKKRKHKAFNVPPYYSSDLLVYNYSNKTGLLEFPRHFLNGKSVLAYAQTKVCSEVDRELILLLGSTDGLAVFLNDKEVYFNSKNRKFYGFTNAIKIHLQKGENKIEIKCFYDQRFSKGKDWRVACKLMNMDTYYNTYLYQKQDYLESPVVPLFQNLIIKDSSVLHFPIHRGLIKDLEGKEVMEFNCEESRRVSLAGLSQGLYLLEFYTDKNKYEQYIFHGDIISAINRIESDFSKEEIGGKYSDSLGVLTMLERKALLYNHYYPQRQLKVEVSDDNIHYHLVDTVLNFPSRMVHLPNSKYVRLSSEGTNPVSEIKLYNDEYIELPWISEYENEKKQVVDNDRRTTWKPNRGYAKSIVIETLGDTLASNIQIISQQNNWHSAIERKWMFIYSELLKLTLSGNKKGLVRGGTHFSSIVSPVDQTLQPYVIQSPKDYGGGEKMPLVVAIPVAMSNKMPFLKSIVVANHANLEHAQFFVDKFKFVRVIPSVRALNLQNVPICEADIMATINAVKKQYNIDEDRIYLSSICGGVSTAINFAKAHLQLFAAISLDEISVSTESHNVIEDRELPTNMLENIAHIPVFITQGEKNSHSPISDSDAFVHELKKNGMKVEYIVFPDEIKIMKNKMRDLDLSFKFLLDHHKVVPDTLSLSSYSGKTKRSFWLEIEPLEFGKYSHTKAIINRNEIQIECRNVNQVSLYTTLLPCDLDEKIEVLINGERVEYDPPFNEKIELLIKKECRGLKKIEGKEGPILDVYRSRFVLVQGTCGSEEQCQINKQIICKFKQLWQEDFFVEPPLIKDVDVSEEMLQTCNLVLVGNQYSNSIVKRLYPHLPQHLMSGGVSISGQTVAANDVAYTFVYPNPEYPHNYVQVLAANGNVPVNWAFRNLSLSGFYDYEIYVKQGNEHVMAGLGHFDNNWHF